MGEILTGKCEKCGFIGQINRVDEMLSFPCECHSPHHFILHDLCEECYNTFRDDPERMVHFEVSVDTFNIFMKAHAYYYPKNPERKLSFKDLSPEYFIRNRKAYIRDVRDCWGCATCLKICPLNAISMYLGADIGGDGTTMIVKPVGNVLHWIFESPEGQKLFVDTDRTKSNKY